MVQADGAKAGHFKTAIDKNGNKSSMPFGDVIVYNMWVLWKASHRYVSLPLKQNSKKLSIEKISIIYLYIHSQY